MDTLVTVIVAGVSVNGFVTFVVRTFETVRTARCGLRGREPARSHAPHASHDATITNPALVRQHERMSDAAYPPEPWFLAGQMLVSTFLVEPRDIPGLDAALPDGHRLVLVRGRAVVGVASVTYDARGMLEYDELLVGVLTRTRGALRVTIPQIWVSTEQSAAGGRES